MRAIVCRLTRLDHSEFVVWASPNKRRSSDKFVTYTNPLLMTRLAGNSKPIGDPCASMPPKSPSLAMTRPELSSTTISSDWFAATQRLSASSISKPSAPLMLLTKTSGVPGVPPGPNGIFTIVSLPVFATNNADAALLKARPLAPNGGAPLVSSNGAATPCVAPPPAGPGRPDSPRQQNGGGTHPPAAQR